MKNILQLLIVLLFQLFLTSCGSNNQDNSPLAKEGFSIDEKKFVHRLFLSEYLWYDEVKDSIDYGSISTPSMLVDTLAVSRDKWSFAITKEEYENYVNQKTAGFGFGYVGRGDFKIYMVRIDSPAWGKLYRGDTILQVNHQTASDQNIAQASNRINELSVFKVLRNGREIEVGITPRNYTFKVSLGKIIQHNNKNIGYLRYDSFTGSSVDELEKIFDKFKQNNISELIIDLRYNGGGSIAVASSLLDNITNSHPGERQGYLDWNENYKNKNNSFYFEDIDDQDGNELNMKRIFFLVSKNSASASELVISALKPYLGDNNVITIGDRTHGKPVGMEGRSYKNNYYFLINFIVRNDNDKTTPFEGIAVSCKAEDNLDFQRGSKEESMLKTALGYIDNSRCP